MHCVQNVTSDVYWVGGNDRRLELFENMFPLPYGVSYNSYLIMDDKTALLDTVDTAVNNQYFENIAFALKGRQLDYLIVNHMEPDHCAGIEDIIKRYPDVKIVGNRKTFQFFEQFYSIEHKSNYHMVSEGDELNIGKHTFKFYFAPMVHWPEVMFTYEKSERMLFSADAFGTFGAHSGNIFSDETDFEMVYLDEARRYYSNIVGKYGAQVQSAMEKLSKEDIDIICPLHGPIWRKDLSYILDKYDKWSKYEPEKQGVVLVYASMYGNTENVINIMGNKLAKQGVKDIRIYDVSKTHPSYIISDAWKYSHLVVGAPTYNMGLYYGMENLLNEMAGLQFRNRKVAVVGNYTWACRSTPKMIELLHKMKNTQIIGSPFEVQSSMKAEQEETLDELIKEIIESME